MDDEHLKRIATRILEQAASKETWRDGITHWWGHDTDCGTDEELMATCLEILKEELASDLSEISTEIAEVQRVSD